MADKSKSLQDTMHELLYEVRQTRKLRDGTRGLFEIGGDKSMNSSSVIYLREIHKIMQQIQFQLTELKKDIESTDVLSSHISSGLASTPSNTTKEHIFSRSNFSQNVLEQQSDLSDMLLSTLKGPPSTSSPTGNHLSYPSPYGGYDSHYPYAIPTMPVASTSNHIQYMESDRHMNTINELFATASKHNNPLEGLPAPLINSLYPSPPTLQQCLTQIETCNVVPSFSIPESSTLHTVTSLTQSSVVPETQQHDTGTSIKNGPLQSSNRSCLTVDTSTKPTLSSLTYCNVIKTMNPTTPEKEEVVSF